MKRTIKAGLLLAGVMTLGLGGQLTADAPTQGSHERVVSHPTLFQCEVLWKDLKPTISTERLCLAPIQEEHRQPYCDLYADPIVMKEYARGPRAKEQTSQRFDGWQKRWDQNGFSALVVTDASSNAFVGHAIMGRGDVENDPVTGEIITDQGWSEMAMVIATPYWNSAYKDPKRDIGTANQKGIGTEVVRGVVAYAKDMFEKKKGVPSDIVESQRSELELLIKNGKVKEGMRDDKGKLAYVYLPFTHLRATVKKTNTASLRILEKVFVHESGGSYRQHPTDETRWLFEIDLREA